MAREVIAQLRQYGVTKRGWLGVRVQQVTDDVAEGLGLASDSGALVADVTPGGPAAKAGMQTGDLITGFDGKPIPDSRALPRLVADTPVGKAVNVDFLRGGKKQTVHLTVAKLDDAEDRAAAPKPTPAPSKPGSALSDLGLTLGALDAPARAKFHVGADVQGVVVTDVNPDSPAGDNNLHPGDVIVQLQNQPMHTPDDVSKRIDADAKAGKKIELMLVSRDGINTFVALRLVSAG
jgi:serine protease Do